MKKNRFLTIIVIFLLLTSCIGSYDNRYSFVKYQISFLHKTADTLKDVKMIQKIRCNKSGAFYIISEFSDNNKAVIVSDSNGILTFYQLGQLVGGGALFLYIDKLFSKKIKFSETSNSLKNCKLIFYDKNGNRIYKIRLDKLYKLAREENEHNGNIKFIKGDVPIHGQYKSVEMLEYKKSIVIK